MRKNALLILVIFIIAATVQADSTNKKKQEKKSYQPVISRVFPDLEQGIIIIEGRNFGSDPTVLIATLAGTTCELPIIEALDERITVILEEIEAGSYPLMVVRDKPANKIDFIDFTIGIVGPQGAQGIQGEKGDQGEQGEKGEQGIQGIPGEVPGLTTKVFKGIFESNGNVASNWFAEDIYPFTSKPGFVDIFLLMNDMDSALSWKVFRAQYVVTPEGNCNLKHQLINDSNGDPGDVSLLKSSSKDIQVKISDLPNGHRTAYTIIVRYLPSAE